MDTRDVNALMTQALAEKERDDLDQLGRAQTGGPMTEIELREGAIVQVMGQPGCWMIARFIARGVVVVPFALNVSVFRQSTEG